MELNPLSLSQIKSIISATGAENAKSDNPTQEGFGAILKTANAPDMTAPVMAPSISNLGKGAQELDVLQALIANAVGKQGLDKSSAASIPLEQSSTPPSEVVNTAGDLNVLALNLINTPQKLSGEALPVEANANGLSALVSKLSTTSDSLTSIRERLRELSREFSGAVLNQIRKPDSRFSTLQGGQGQVDMEAEFGAMKALRDVKAEPALDQLAALIESRTGESKSEVLSLLAKTITKSQSGSGAKKLEGLLKASQLEVDFDQGILKDLSTQTVTAKTGQSSDVMVGDVLGQLEKIVSGQESPIPDERSPIVPSAVSGALPAKHNEPELSSTLDKAATLSEANQIVPAQAEKILKDQHENNSSGSDEKSGNLSHMIHHTASSNEHRGDDAKNIQNSIRPMDLTLMSRLSHPENRQGIITSVQTLSTAGGGQMTITLRPAELGKLKIQVTKEGDQLFIRADAERADVAQRIKEDMPVLLKGLEDKGIAVTKMEVGVQSSSIAQESRGPRGGQDNFFDQRGRRENPFLEKDQEQYQQRPQPQFDLMDMVA